MQVIDQTADGTMLDLRVGEVAELRLPETPSTGYRWQLRETAAPTCRVAEADRGTQADAPPGQGCTHTWRIEGAQPGTGTLSLEYGRPWQAGAGRRFSLGLRVAP